MKYGLKKLLHLLPLMVMWAMLCAMFWGWIFTYLTDTDPQHKLTLYVHAQVTDGTTLAAALEEAVTEESIRMAQVRPFTYAMMSSEGLRGADLYLVPEEDTEEFGEWFLTEALALTGGENPYLGLEEGKTYRLYYGKASLHAPGAENALDTAAEQAVLALPGLLGLSPAGSGE